MTHDKNDKNLDEKSEIINLSNSIIPQINLFPSSGQHAFTFLFSMFQIKRVVTFFSVRNKLVSLPYLNFSLNNHFVSDHR